jgi:hypothetical protein
LEGKLNSTLNPAIDQVDEAKASIDTAQITIESYNVTKYVADVDSAQAQLDNGRSQLYVNDIYAALQTMNTSLSFSYTSLYVHCSSGKMPRPNCVLRVQGRCGIAKPSVDELPDPNLCDQQLEHRHHVSELTDHKCGDSSQSCSVAEARQLRQHAVRLLHR